MFYFYLKMHQKLIGGSSKEARSPSQALKQIYGQKTRTRGKERRAANWEWAGGKKAGNEEEWDNEKSIDVQTLFYVFLHFLLTFTTFL